MSPPLQADHNQHARIAHHASLQHMMVSYEGTIKVSSKYGLPLSAKHYHLKI